MSGKERWWGQCEDRGIPFFPLFLLSRNMALCDDLTERAVTVFVSCLKVKSFPQRWKEIWTRGSGHILISILRLRHFLVFRLDFPMGSGEGE